jgi:hypothetical protein
MTDVTIKSSIYGGDTVTLEKLRYFDRISMESDDESNNVDIHMTFEEARKLANELLRMAGPAPKPEPTPVSKPQGYTALTPQAQTIYQHMRRAGSISSREAMSDYGITSGSLARRVVDMEEAGFTIIRDRRVHPITRRRYTRYSVVA